MNALQLPDVSSEPFLNMYAYPLDWVGMENIALPIQIQNTLCASKVNAYVSLDDPQAKGIHMSRLYTRLLELHALPDLTLSKIYQALQDFLASHTELSQQARLDIQAEFNLEQPALVSALSGWKSYPFNLSCKLSEHTFEAELAIEITYSSTCPCSAALARDLIQKSFQDAIDTKKINPQNTDEVMAWLGTTDAIVATLNTRQVCYWSRSRKCLWRKGESSGHRQKLIEARLDCDGDSILFLVEQAGPACHTNRPSCFYLGLNTQHATILTQPII